VAVLGVLDDLEPDEYALLVSHLPNAATVGHAGDIQHRLANASILLSRNHDVGGRILSLAPVAQAVIKIDSYLGSVDDAACEQRGVDVHHVPAVSILSVAEHAVMAMLALEKRLLVAEKLLRDGVVIGDVRPARTTQDSYAYNWVGLERFGSLYGRRVGLVGLGTIGTAVAARLQWFGCHILAATRRPLSPEQAALGIERLPFEELLATADHVSLHVRAEPGNRHLMGEREFQAMRPGSYFTNTARGALVDESALVAALESGHLAGAALDVFDFEPLPPDSRLLSAPNTILTPHVAGVPAGTIHPAELPKIATIVKRYLDGP
jgi:phosphoglycerate dehydrogenase-like enzyme